jgi:hypothetical protein
MAVPWAIIVQNYLYCIIIIIIELYKGLLYYLN